MWPLALEAERASDGYRDRISHRTFYACAGKSERIKGNMKQIKDKEYEEFQQYLYNKTHGYIWTPDTLELICGSNDNDL